MTTIKGLTELLDLYDNTLNSHKSLIIFIFDLVVAGSIIALLPSGTALFSQHGYVIGAFIAVFVYDGIANDVYLFFIVFFLILGSYYVSRQRAMIRSIFLILASVSIAIYANLIWEQISPISYTSAGQSGIVYAFTGIVVGLAGDNCIISSKSFISLLNEQKIVSKKGKVPAIDVTAKFLPFMANILLIALILSEWIILPAFFFQKGGNTNLFVHEHAFVLGFEIGIAYLIAEILVQFTSRRDRRNMQV